MFWVQGLLKVGMLGQGQLLVGRSAVEEYRRNEKVEQV